MPIWDDEDAPVWDSDEPGAVWDEEPPAKIRIKRMTHLQYDDLLGFGGLLRGAANQYKVQLMAAVNPHDPTAMIASTITAGEAVGKQRSDAKIAMDEAVRLTAIAETGKQELYASLNNWCNLLASTLGKESPEGKRILAIRATLNPRPSKKTKPVTPPGS